LRAALPASYILGLEPNSLAGNAECSVLRAALATPTDSDPTIRPIEGALARGIVESSEDRTSVASGNLLQSSITALRKSASLASSTIRMLNHSYDLVVHVLEGSDRLRGYSELDGRF
jgi:hypothetical protein